MTQESECAEEMPGCDTAPEVAALWNRMWLERTPEERLRMGEKMFLDARRLILASLPPGLSDEEVKRRLYERMYGESLPEDFFNKRK